MTPTDLDLDDDLVDAVMRKYGLKTRSAAVDLALRRLVGTPATKEFPSAPKARDGKLP
jgi:Arc/MetJ family transcription regulator